MNNKTLPRSKQKKDPRVPELNCIRVSRYFGGSRQVAGATGEKVAAVTLRHGRWSRRGDSNPGPAHYECNEGTIYQYPALIINVSQLPFFPWYRQLHYSSTCITYS